MSQSRIDMLKKLRQNLIGEYTAYRGSFLPKKPTEITDQLLYTELAIRYPHNTNIKPAYIYKPAPSELLFSIELDDPYQVYAHLIIANRKNPEIRAIINPEYLAKAAEKNAEIRGILQKSTYLKEVVQAFPKIETPADLKVESKMSAPPAPSAPPQTVRPAASSDNQAIPVAGEGGPPPAYNPFMLSMPEPSAPPQTIRAAASVGALNFFTGPPPAEHSPSAIPDLSQQKKMLSEALVGLTDRKYAQAVFMISELMEIIKLIPKHRPEIAAGIFQEIRNTITKSQSSDKTLSELLHDSCNNGGLYFKILGADGVLAQDNILSIRLAEMVKKANEGKLGPPRRIR